MKHDKDFNLHIFTKNYHSQVKKLEENLYLTNRTHKYHKDFKHVETFGSNWVLFLADIKNLQITVTANSKSIVLSGKCALFIPAFFIIEWQVPEGTYHWQCISSSNTKSFPQDLYALEWNKDTELNSHQKISHFLKNENITGQISDSETPSKVALAAKEYIQENYRSDLKMEQLSQALSYHRIYLSREFKKNYHISLVEYRHQLRIYEALKQMNFGKNLTDAIFLSGYSSVNQFIAYFKKYFLTIPSEYNFNKPKKRELSSSL